MLTSKSECMVNDKHIVGGAAIEPQLPYMSTSAGRATFVEGCFSVYLITTISNNWAARLGGRIDHYLAFCCSLIMMTVRCVNRKHSSSQLCFLVWYYVIRDRNGKPCVFSKFQCNFLRLGVLICYNRL